MPWKVPATSGAARRLTDIDLFVVFMTYLVSVEGLSVGLSPLVRSYAHRLLALPASTVSIVDASLTSVTYLVAGAVPIAILCWLARRRGANLADEIGLTRRQLGPNVLYGIGGFCISRPVYLIVAFVAAILFKHAPAPANPVIPEVLSSQSWLAQAMLAGIAVVAAPLVEETLFRGVLYTAIKIRFGVWPGILLSGLVFGFLHPVGHLEQVTLASLGMVFAWMAETRKSLAPSMVAHAIQNGGTLLLLLAAVQA
jgi:membrane protease YdiL (CAAX protease family)